MTKSSQISPSQLGGIQISYHPLVKKPLILNDVTFKHFAVSHFPFQVMEIFKKLTTDSETKKLILLVCPLWRPFLLSRPLINIHLMRCGVQITQCIIQNKINRILLTNNAYSTLMIYAYLENKTYQYKPPRY